MMNPWQQTAALIAALVAGSVTLGCASFNPKPLEEIPFLERAKTQERDGIRVTVAVPTRKEAKQAFGVDLAESQIQPVWFEIENQTDIPYVFLLSGFDPMYFSAREAAYKNHWRFRPFTNRKMDDHFSDHHLDPFVLPHGSTAGFAFGNLKLGTKRVQVQLYGPRRVHIFEFYVPVPGFRADYHEVDWDALLAQEFTDFEKEEELRATLRELPCCTTNSLGWGEGDPLNLIIIGDGPQLKDALIRAGWDETERLTFASAWRTFKAFFGGEYKYSPMSSLYVFGRPQDAGFQQARDTIHERNHLRLWFAPMRFRGKQVWIGTITRDIGVYFTTRAWNLTTHAIDPAVDEARLSIREDFQVAQSIERWGYVEGVGASTREEPHRNLMNAPWWSDGRRLVMELSEEPVPLEEQSFFFWAWGSEESEELIERLRELMAE